MTAQTFDGPAYGGPPVVHVPLTDQLMALLRSYRDSQGITGEPDEKLSPGEAQALLMDYLEDQERAMAAAELSAEFEAEHGPLSEQDETDLADTKRAAADKWQAWLTELGLTEQGETGTWRRAG